MKNIVIFVVTVIMPVLSCFTMPTKQEIQKAQPMVAELMAETMAEVNAKKKTFSEAADVSLRFAADAESETAKYLLLRGAVFLYVRGGAFDQAVDAYDRLLKEVKGIPVETLSEMLTSLLAGVGAEKAPRLYSRYRDVRRILEAKKEIVTIESNLRKSPTDPNLRRRLAECYVRADDWSTALKHFARLGKDFAAIAAFEKSGEATETVNALTVADFWWGYSVPDAALFKAHAAEWYRKAMEADLLTGLRRELVAKRLAELEKPKPVMQIPVKRDDKIDTGLYCVIDLSAGADAEHYPVSYLNNLPDGGFNTETFKTVKLVLRRITPGSFKMDGKYAVTLTSPFYCGIVEVTQKQYMLVMGSNPSMQKGDMRPVENVSYHTIRGSSEGTKWPSSSTVDPSSFMGKLRARTGLDFDLPTEAQWEYACRAGTASVYNNGFNSTEDLKRLGRYKDNHSDARGGYSSKHTTVGSYEPNEWGLYDMHGNVWEWCLDLYSSSLLNDVTDPKGASSETLRDRVFRGGCWGNDANGCTSSCRDHFDPSRDNIGGGFRLFITERHVERPQITNVEKPAPVVPSWMQKQQPKRRAGVSKRMKLPGGTEMLFRWCPPGTFTMGNVDENVPEHSVTLTKGFWLGATEVTQSQWEGVMGNNPSLNKGANLPVERVSWNDCKDFIDKVNAQLNCGMRLPTEAEWEYACRMGGKELSGDFDSISWNTHNSKNRTHPVGQLKANQWGLCDMQGNVREWCGDWLGEISDKPVTDPIGPIESTGKRLHRGSDCGSWWKDTRREVYNRVGLPPGDKRATIGFRVVLSDE